MFHVVNESVQCSECADIPDKQRLEELDDDDKAEGHQDQAQVDKQHQTTNSLRIGTKWVGGCHGLDYKTAFARSLCLHRRNFGGCLTAAVGVVAGRLAVAAVAGTSAVTAVRIVLHCAGPDSATVPLWDLCEWRHSSLYLPKIH